MEARRIRIALFLLAVGSLGAVYRTPNFVVHASSAAVAKQVALTAEQSRKQIARDWLGHSLPLWDKPCQVTVQTGQMGAGGATSFQFDRGEVFGWTMRVQGTLERILDSVIPHEVSHTIFACYFRRPLPRWADEGAATLVEHESEQRRQRVLLNQVLNTRQRIPLRRLLSMTEYPSSSHQVLVLYAQGFSLADFLVQTGGKSRYLQFLKDAHQHGWEPAVRREYRFESVEALEQQWTGWALAGSPRLDLPEGTQLADADQSRTDGGDEPRRSPDPDLIVRSQSPDRDDAGFQQAGEPSSDDSGESPPGAEWLVSAGDQRGDEPNPNENPQSIPLPRTADESARADGVPLSRQGLTLPLLTVPYRRSQASSGEQQPTSSGTSTDAVEFPRARPINGPRRVPPDPLPAVPARSDHPPHDPSFPSGSMDRTPSR